MTKIEWTGTSWNPIVGCSKVSTGCKHCYAERMAKRLVAMGQERYDRVVTDGRWNGTTDFCANTLAKPLRWRKPRRVFVNSMGDLFHPSVSNEQIAAVYGVMAATPQHTYQVLTKYAARMVEWYEWAREADYKSGGMLDHEARLQGVFERHDGNVRARMYSTWPLSYVHVLVSAENQATLDERVPLLLQISAAVRGVSLEPLLGPVGIDVNWLLPRCPGCGRHSAVRAGSCAFWDCGLPLGDQPLLDWVIVGGESGPGARACAVEWIRSVVQQCKAAGVPVFVKQLGSKPTIGGKPLRLKSRKGNDMSEWPEDLRVRETPR